MNDDLGAVVRPAATTEAPSPDRHDALFDTLYDELRRIARREAARAGSPAALSATTLVHEAYLNISKGSTPSFENRAHFLGYAARAMRMLVIDRLRADGAQKRGGGLDITSLDTRSAEDIAEPGLVLDVGSALGELAQLEPALAEIVDLKFFCGFALVDIAALHGVSERTVQRQWVKARLLLFRILSRER